MKKIFLTIILTLILIFVVINHKTISNQNLNNSKSTIQEKEPNRIDIQLNNMTIEEKIGQMLIIDYQKPTFDAELKNILEIVRPGGFILFRENFKNYNQSIELINNIKSTSHIPMFISIDQEGGRVQRLKNLKGTSVTTIPSMAKIGKTKNIETAYNTGKNIATDLKKFSINMNFAPVIDVYSNSKNKVIGDRSFGNDPYLVSKMGISLSNGLKDNSIIPVFKHFPGHGNTETDSHYDLPLINKTKEELLNLDIIPFKEVIKNEADIIMVGHLAVPSISNNNTPASLSKDIINNFLKSELNFQGIVITDALNMKAITDNYTDKEIYKLAINAGVDILLMPNNPIEAINLIKELINENEITEEQINSSVEKILKLKAKYNIE